MKFSLDSVAIAFAIIVLLHPGGPYKSIPLLGYMPKRANLEAWVKGSSTTFFIYFFTD